jgi:hypothetical protein
MRARNPDNYPAIDREPVMPFGKYKGMALARLPQDYADHLLKQEWLKPDLRSALERCARDRYPQIDGKFPLQATHNRASLDRQFAQKAQALQRLRETYETEPRTEYSGRRPSTARRKPSIRPSTS